MKTNFTLQNKQDSHAINSIDENITPHQIPNQSKHQTLRKKRFSKTKLKYILGGLALFLITLGGASAFFLSQTNQDIRQQASADPLKVDLTINPNHLSAQKNQAINIPLVFDTKNATLTAADVHLNFNPALIKINSITKADLSLELAAPQIENDHANFTFAASLDSGGIKGTGTLAIINAELLQENKGSIIISDATQVAIKDSTENELGDKTSHDLEYNGGNPASPSPASSPSPSPSPTSDPISSPSPSPTPTTSPQASPSPTPSPTPTNNTKICIQDAKQCPDGSWVGRTGPNCEFVCPDSNNSDAGQNDDQDQDNKLDDSNDSNQDSTIKSCNQACSSSGECEVNHFCYSGYCRLVDNPASTTCSTANNDTTNNNVDASNNYNDKNNTNNTQQLAAIATPSINVISVDSQLDKEIPNPTYKPLPTSEPATTPTYKPVSTYTPKPYVPSLSPKPIEKKEASSFFERIIEFFANLFS